LAAASQLYRGISKLFVYMTNGAAEVSFKMPNARGAVCKKYLNARTNTHKTIAKIKIRVIIYVGSVFLRDRRAV
jgi:hypothetical protein